MGASSSKHEVPWCKVDRVDDRDVVVSFASPRDGLPSEFQIQPAAARPVVAGESGAGPACAAVAAANCVLSAATGEPIEGSPLFAYYNARAIEGTTAVDCGCSIRDVLEGMRRHGVCPLDLHHNQEDIEAEPSEEAYDAARRHPIASYGRLARPSTAAIKRALVAGYPVIASLPARADRLHAVLIDGFDDERAEFRAAHFLDEAAADACLGEANDGDQRARVPYSDVPEMRDAWVITGSASYAFGD